MLKIYVRIIFVTLLYYICLYSSNLPDPITDLKATAYFKAINLNWSIPNSEDPIVYYEIRFSTTKVILTENDWNQASNIIEIFNGSTTSYLITDLINNKVYYFAIRSSTSTSKIPLSNININSNESFAIPFNTQPQPFNLLYPTYSTIVTSSEIKFSWYDSYDPDIDFDDFLIYELAISTYSSNLFSFPVSFIGAKVIDNITTNYYLLNAYDLLDNLTYYWRLRVRDSEEKSNYSLNNIELSKFILNHTPESPTTFNLLLPISGSTVTSPGIFLDWQDSYDKDPNDSIVYLLYISSISEFSGFRLIDDNITNSYYNLTNLPPIFGDFKENTTYWWYIIAKDTTDILTKSNETFRFIVNNYSEEPYPNNPISPGVEIYNPIELVYTLNPKFFWSMSFDPDPYSILYYQLYLSSYSELPDVQNSFYSIYSNKIYTTFYYLNSNELEDDNTYYWRIRIWDEVYSDNSWSSTVNWFYTCKELKSALLKHPDNNSTTSYFYPRFEWETNMSYYKNKISSQTLIYWTENDTTVVSGLSILENFYTPTSPLKNNATYYWQIITYDHIFSPPMLTSATAVFKFYIRNSSPTNFDLIYPSSTIIDTSFVDLLWQESFEPDNESLIYEIFYSTDNFLTLSSFSVLSNNLRIDNLIDNATYHWFVKAKDPWGNSNFSNSTFSFVVNYIPENPSNFDLIYPNNNKLIRDTYTTFYWQISIDPDPYESVIYELKISEDKNFKNIVFSTKTFSSSFFLSKGYLKVNTSYYWLVIASSTGSGFVFSSSTFSFKISNTAPLGLRLIDPPNYNIVKSTPLTLKWSVAYDPEDDEFFYKVVYSTCIDNNDILLATKTFIVEEQQNFYIIDDLIDDVTYYWYVLAIDTYNNINKTSTNIFYTSFDNQVPTKPYIIKPQNDNEIIFLPYRIEWTDSFDFDLFDEVKYTLHISTYEDFSNFITLVSSTSDNYFDIYNFELQPTKYYLRILAFDKSYSFNYSTISFNIDQYYINVSSPYNGYIVERLPIEFYFSKIQPFYNQDFISYKIIYSSYSDFSFKKEKILQQNYFFLEGEILNPSTYYWYVEVYYNNFFAGSSNKLNFIIPHVYPLSPQNVNISTFSNQVILSWDSVDINNLLGYKIYSGFNLNKLVQIAFTTSTFFIDTSGFDKQLFYMVSSINHFGLESISNTYVRVYLGKKSNFYISEDKIIVLTVLPEEDLSNVVISRINEEETNSIVYVFDIKANKILLKNPAEISISKQNNISQNYVIQYYDGKNWINIFSQDLSDSIVIRTYYLGKYRVINTLAKDEDLLTILGCSPKKKIITPNNDGINDYIEFQYKNGTFIEGEIYDVNFRKVCLLKRKQNNILYFDGKDDNLNFLPPGIYFYYIKTQPDNKIFKDTILIKY